MNTSFILRSISTFLSLMRNLWYAVPNENIIIEFFEKGTSDKTRASIVNDVEKEITKICNPNSLNLIENGVNDCMDNIIKKLRNQCPRFKQDDYIFFMLIYAGFSPRAVCIFTNIKLKNYYNKRARLIDRIERTDAPDKELFIATRCLFYFHSLYHKG